MAMERTTRIHTGKTPIPGMASATSPGSSAHRRPRIRNNTTAVPTSSAHCTGTAITVQNDKMSETAATAKARASIAREGRFDGAIGSATGRLIVLSDCIAILLLMLLNIARLDRAMTATESQPRLEQVRLEPGVRTIERLFAEKECRVRPIVLSTLYTWGRGYFLGEFRAVRRAEAF